MLNSPASGPSCLSVRPMKIYTENRSRLLSRLSV
jgi:hypothetical protein